MLFKKTKPNEERITIWEIVLYHLEEATHYEADTNVHHHPFDNRDFIRPSSFYTDIDHFIAIIEQHMKHDAEQSNFKITEEQRKRAYKCFEMAYPFTVGDNQEEIEKLLEEEGVSGWPILYTLIYSTLCYALSGLLPHNYYKLPKIDYYNGHCFD